MAGMMEEVNDGEKEGVEEQLSNETNMSSWNLSFGLTDVQMNYRHQSGNQKHMVCYYELGNPEHFTVAST